MPINRRIDRQSPVYSHEVILLSNKNWVTTDIHSNMDVSQKHYVKWKGTDINQLHIVWTHLYEIPEWKTIVIKTDKLLSRARGCKEQYKWTLGDNVLCHDHGGIYMTINIVKTYPIKTLRWWIILYKLYLSKADKKTKNMHIKKTVELC